MFSRIHFANLCWHPEVLYASKPFSLSQLISNYEQVQVLSISQSDLRPTSDKLLSSELLARGLKSYFKGLQSMKEIVILQGYYSVNPFVQETDQKFIPKDGS